MKILVIADVESPYYWDFYSEDKLKGIDLIISCGDLAPQYLSFLVTLSMFLFCMYTGITMDATRIPLLMDVFVLMTGYMYTMD